MSNHTFLINLGITLLAALIGGILARLCRLPVIMGYLLAGVVVGPHTPGVLANRASIEPIAQVGVALLMFAVGVHFSLAEIRAVLKTAVLGGALQIGGTILLGIVVGLSFGWGVYGGLFLGCALALSSTAVMMKILEERGEQGTNHGKVMLGILVVQDLSLVLMMVMLPALGSLFSSGTPTSAGTSPAADVALALIRAGLFLAGTLLLAVRGVPALLNQVARTNSRELFLLTVVCVCLGAAIAADYLGLGVELGAFVAGIVISETDYAHEVFSQVRPLRDVLASLFFVSVGMLLNPTFLIRNWLPVVVVVLAIAVGKSIVSFLAVYALGWHGRVAIVAGLGLAQIGEFSFVLATMGHNRGLIDPKIADVLLTAALISLLLSPFLYQAAFPLYARLNRNTALSGLLNRHHVAHSAGFVGGAPASEMCTVVVLGHGRVGRYVSESLRSNGILHIVVDLDVAALAPLRHRGDELAHFVYGDASSSTVLEHANIRHANLAVVALPEADVTEMVVRNIRRIAPSVQIVARVHRGIDIPRVRHAGADAVIHAEFEAATEMIRQCLDRLGVADSEVDTYIETIRQHRYRQEDIGETIGY